MTRKHKAQLTLLLIVVVLGTVSFLNYSNLLGFIDEVKWIRHSNNVIKSLEATLSSLKDSETGYRGFLLTNDSTFLKPYYLAVDSIGHQVRELDSLVFDQQQQQRVDTLLTLIKTQFAIAKDILASTKGPYLNERERQLIQEGKANMDKVRMIIEHIRSAQDDILYSRVAREESLKNIAPIALLSYTLFAIGACVVLFFRVLDSLEKTEKAETLLVDKNESLRHEISLRQFTQVLLRNTLDTSLSSTMVFKAVRDSDKKIIDFEWILANKASLQSIGKTEEEVLGKRLLDVMPANKEEGLFDIYTNVVERGKEAILEKFYQGENMNRWFHIEAIKMEDGFVVTFSDITQQKEREEQLRRAINDLKRSNDDLEQFAYVASHDLQEPLRKIRAFGDLLISEFEAQKEAHDYVQRMQNAAARMQTLIQDLLTFSRVSRNAIQYTGVSISEIVVEIKEILENQIEREKATFTENNINIAIRGDKAQLKRLFQNLISNAIKFHKPGIPPVIAITVRSPDPDELKELFPMADPHRKYMLFSIEDNGIGFDQQYAEKIFNIFQRLHGRIDYEGTGIGLAICRKIVMNHRGFITALGEDQIGANFVFILPE